jgi:hypothetical protein
MDSGQQTIKETRNKRQREREREICLRKALASGWKTIASARLAMDILYKATLFRQDWVQQQQQFIQ